MQLHVGEWTYSIVKSKIIFTFIDASFYTNFKLINICDENNDSNTIWQSHRNHTMAASFYECLW